MINTNISEWILDFEAILEVFIMFPNKVLIYYNKNVLRILFFGRTQKFKIKMWKSRMEQTIFRKNTVENI